MFTKYLQKFLIYFFTITFVVVLMVGVFKYHQNKEKAEATPVPTTGGGEPSTSTSTTTENTTSPTGGTAQTQTNSNTASDSSSQTTTQSTSQTTTQSTTSPKTYTGKTYQNPWGNVTVQITVTDGKISAVTTPNYPDSPPSTYARQYLIQQALEAGSANIQGVSGATSTSLAFQYSLESAIAQAGLK